MLLSPEFAAGAADSAYLTDNVADTANPLGGNLIGGKPYVDAGFGAPGSLGSGMIQADTGFGAVGTAGLLAAGLSAGVFSGTSIALTAAAAVMHKKRRGMIFTARGSGEFKDHLIVAIRGTDNLQDLATDLNASAAGRFGIGRVHGGFSDTFDSFINELSNSVNNFNGFKAIHCVGHSLGGALGTLLAAHLLSKQFNNVYCYTFGAPRVGDDDFTDWMNSRINKEQFKRVFHPGDPVPMVPIFPFFHAPSDSGIKLNMPNGTLISASHHRMGGSYLPAVRGKSWETLEANQNLPPNWRLEIEAWLNGERTVYDVGVSSAFLMGQITKAIVFILEQMGISTLSTLVTVSATILDHLAEALYAFANMAVKFAKWVTKLIVSIMRFLGKVIDATVDITVSFLRWVLDAFKAQIMNLAMMAGQVRDSLF